MVAVTVVRWQIGAYALSARPSRSRRARCGNEVLFRRFTWWYCWQYVWQIAI